MQALVVVPEVAADDSVAAKRDSDGHKWPQLMQALVVVPAVGTDDSVARQPVPAKRDSDGRQ